MSRVNILFDGRRGKPGVKGDPGDAGPAGPGFVARGPFSTGGTYGPGDAVTDDSSLTAGILSLFIQRPSVERSPALLRPRDDPNRWAEVGVYDLSRFTGAIWRVVQPLHGFTAIGQPVAYSPGANRWVLASNKIGEAPATAVVRDIINAGEVVLQGSGEISGLNPAAITPVAAAFLPGRLYYVSSETGKLTLEPTAPSTGFASNAMLVATGPASGVVLQWQQTPNVVGRRPVGFNDFFYTAAGGQTVFTGPDLDGNTLDYPVSDQTQVVVDGLFLSRRDQFTAADGTSVVLAVAPGAGARVQIRTMAEPLQAAVPAVTLPADNVAASFDGNARRFPLTTGGGSPVSLGPAHNVLVVLDGNIIEPDIDYQLVVGATTNTDIEFTRPPPAGMRFWAIVGTPVSGVAPVTTELMFDGEPLTFDGEPLTFTGPATP